MKNMVKKEKDRVEKLTKNTVLTFPITYSNSYIYIYIQTFKSLYIQKVVIYLSFHYAICYGI